MAPKKVWLAWSWPWYSPEFSGGLAFDGLLIRERFTHSDKKRHGMPSKDLKIFFVAVCISNKRHIYLRSCGN